MTFKGFKYGMDVKRTIDVLDSKIQEFKAEADVCAQRRLGRIEDVSVKNLTATESSCTLLSGK